MRIISEQKLIADGWIKEGNVWHSPVRKKPEEREIEIVESSRKSAETKRKLESQRPDRAAMRARLVESWRAMGLSPEAAEKAADIRR